MSEKKERKKRETDYVIKMSFVGLGLVVILAIIIASWLWNLNFDPSQFDVTKWLNRAVFNNAIGLGTMVLGFVAISESLKAKENGKYQKRIGAFLDKVKDIYESILIVYFDQFIVWYSVKQLRNKKIRYLTSKGMNRMDAEIIVDYASIGDIERLCGLKRGESPTGKTGQDFIKEVKNEDGNTIEVLLPSFEDYYAAYVEEVLNGTITLNVETASYYLSIDKNKDANLESLEQAQAVEEDRIKSVRRSFVSKIIIGLLYLTIFALLVVDYNSDMGSSSAIWEFLLRLFSATIGLISGGFVGILNINFIIKYIGKKRNVLTEYKAFYDNKEFVPKTREQIYGEKLEEVKRREQEAKDSVVEPDVTEGIPLLEQKEEK